MGLFIQPEELQDVNSMSGSDISAIINDSDLPLTASATGSQYARFFKWRPVEGWRFCCKSYWYTNSWLAVRTLPLRSKRTQLGPYPVWSTHWFHHRQGKVPISVVLYINASGYTVINIWGYDDILTHIFWYENILPGRSWRQANFQQLATSCGIKQLIKQ